MLSKYKLKIIADIGCWEAKIAKKLFPIGYNAYSYDLVSIKKYVTVADMKNLQLKNNFCDMGIFFAKLNE